MLILDARVKDLFFDRRAVKDAVRRGTRKALSKAGAYVRKRAKSRLRRRKRTSEPGESPSIHSRDETRTLKRILFAFEPATEGVVVGPVGLGTQRPTVPELMEGGGSQVIVEASPWKSGDKWIPIGRRVPRWAQRVRRRRATYEPRPFMGPALEEEIAAGTIPAQFADVIVG